MSQVHFCIPQEVVCNEKLLVKIAALLFITTLELTKHLIEIVKKIKIY